MNYHLGVNSILREIFELGAPLNLLDASAHKLSKTERVSRKLNFKSGQCVLVDTGMMGETTCWSTSVFTFNQNICRIKQGTFYHKIGNKIPVKLYYLNVLPFYCRMQRTSKPSRCGHKSEARIETRDPLYSSRKIILSGPTGLSGPTTSKNSDRPCAPFI